MSPRQALCIRWNTIPRWKQALLALSIIAISWWIIDSMLVRFPIRSHPMNEYTQNMQPICIGRYLFDVPSQFKLTSMMQAVNGIQIERMPMQIVDRRQFEIEMVRVERTLREELAKLAHSGIYKVLPIDETGRAIAYFRESPEKSLVQIETYIFKDRAVYRLKQDAITEAVDAELQAAQALAASISIRDINTLPTAPGLCIDGGFVAGKEFEQENVSAGFHLVSYPGAGFSIGIDRAGAPVPSEWLNARIDRNWHVEAYAKAAGMLTIHRKASLSLLGQKGDERVFSGMEKGQKLWAAMAEIYGDGSVKRQTYKFDMNNNTFDNATGKEIDNQLPGDLALSIWDGVVQSIRTRPDAF